MVEQRISEKLIGSMCGTYRLEQVIDEHPWGPIFQARNGVGTPYMLRLLTLSSNAMGPMRQVDARIVSLGRFQQEANRVAALTHPHILPLLDYGSFRDMPYLVYPFVGFPSFHTLLKKQGGIDAVTVAYYLDHIADALTYAHLHAVLHRNLTAQCIYLQGSKQLLVADFGLLRMVELSRWDLQTTQRGMDDEEPSLRQPGFSGNSESSAPEQILGKTTDTRTDIYALGVLLYHLLTGHAPFEGQTHNDVARQHLYALIPPLKTWRPGLPVDIDHIITKAMAKEPFQRFHQPLDLARAYREIVTPGETPHVAAATTRLLASAARRSTAPLVRSTQPLQPLAARPLARQQKAHLSRRRFLLAAASGVVAATATAGVVRMEVLQDQTMPAAPHAAQGPTINRPVAQPTPQGKVIAQTTHIPINSATTFALANQRNPAILVHLPDKRFVAFDSTCTHAGCAVTYNPQNHHLECPCHGAVFDPAHAGSVLQGPAPTPLTAIQIVVHPDGTIVEM